jgi:hypothetical protein
MKSMIKSSRPKSQTLSSDSIGGNLFTDEELLALLLGPEINGFWYNALDLMKGEANRLAQTEDANYESAVHKPGSEWASVFGEGGFVYTENYEARVDNEYHNTLINLIGYAAKLIDEAAKSWDLGDGYTYDARAKGSNVRNEKGEFSTKPGVRRGGNKRGDGGYFSGGDGSD